MLGLVAVTFAFTGELKRLTRVSPSLHPLHPSSLSPFLFCFLVFANFESVTCLTCFVQRKAEPIRVCGCPLRGDHIGHTAPEMNGHCALLQRLKLVELWSAAAVRLGLLTTSLCLGGSQSQAASPCVLSLWSSCHTTFPSTFHPCPSS